VLSIFFLFLVQQLIVVFIEVVPVNVGELEGFSGYDFKFGSTFITGDDIALFDFVNFEIQ
jgi:hypothetical protein